MRFSKFFIGLLLLMYACADHPHYDLLIKNATILIVETGERKKQQNIWIKEGKIVQINNHINLSFQQEIDAEGKLVTPGFIDTHIHPTDVFGDYDEAPSFIPKDEAQQFRQKLSNEYLPYGVTTALMMGHPESWLDEMLQWKDGQNLYTDFLTCGGALISKEERKPYIGHFTVEGINEAKSTILDYHNKGIQHIKIYHRLREPEFSAVIQTADSLQMKVFGHIGDFDLSRFSIPQTLEKGLKNYEHMVTFPYSIIRTNEEWQEFDAHFRALFGEVDTIEKVMMMFLEAFRYIDECKKQEADELIQLLAQNQVTFSTTIGYIHRQFAASHYFPSTENSLTEKQKIRSQENFKIMMDYLKKLSESGIPVRIATDSKYGGKTFLTELKILSDHGFSTEEIFRIATINGAKALGLEENIGSIREGNTANLIIWEKSPFDDSNHYFSKKLTIKNGVPIN